MKTATLIAIMVIASCPIAQSKEDMRRDLRSTELNQRGQLDKGDMRRVRDSFILLIQFLLGR